MLRTATIYCCLIGLPAISGAAILHVPDQHPTIKAGVNAAQDGDTVLLAPGVYTGYGNRDVRIESKSVSIFSSAGSDQTIVDCEATPEDTRQAFFVLYSELVSFEGLTFINGLPPRTYSPDRIAAGGAVLLYYSSARFSDCVFRNNMAMSGAGVFIQGGDSTSFENCRFEDNLALTPEHIWGDSAAAPQSVPDNHPAKLGRVAQGLVLRECDGHTGR